MLLYLEDVTIICCIGLRKYLPALRLILSGITASGGIMRYHEFLRSCIDGTLGSLQCRGMKTELRLRLIFLKICSFMIKQVHSFHPSAQFRKRRRIAAICVAPWFIGQISGIFISDNQRFISTGMPYEAIEECSPFVKPRRTISMSRFPPW